MALALCNIIDVSCSVFQDWHCFIFNLLKTQSLIDCCHFDHLSVFVLDVINSLCLSELSESCGLIGSWVSTIKIYRFGGSTCSNCSLGLHNTERSCRQHISFLCLRLPPLLFFSSLNKVLCFSYHWQHKNDIPCQVNRLSNCVTAAACKAT